MENLHGKKPRREEKVLKTKMMNHQTVESQRMALVNEGPPIRTIHPILAKLIHLIHLSLTRKMTRRMRRSSMRSPVLMMKRWWAKTRQISLTRLRSLRSLRNLTSLTNLQIAAMMANNSTLVLLARTNSFRLTSETLTTMSASSPAGLKLRPSLLASCVDLKWID